MTRPVKGARESGSRVGSNSLNADSAVDMSEPPTWMCVREYPMGSESVHLGRTNGAIVDRLYAEGRVVGPQCWIGERDAL